MGFDYKGGRWKAARARALRRDGYRCRECRRYGKRVEATHVHHVWPVEDFPEYAFEAWNHLSLCLGCHDKMHDRLTGRLTELGQRWKNRTPPPQ